MNLFRRSLLLFALLPAVAALPSCSSETPYDLGEVLNSVLVVEVAPNPLIGTQNALTGLVSGTYTITIYETNGLGGEIVFVNGAVYDPTTGRLATQSYYDSKDMLVFVGKKRIEAGGSLALQQTTNYTLPDFGIAATLIVSVQFKDDRGNLVNTSTLVNIQAPATAQ